jgi:hypothetical protein
MSIDWNTLDNARKDILSWVTKEVSGKEMSQHVSDTGKRVANRDERSSESGNKEDDTLMDTSSEEAGPSSTMGGSPVIIEETASKAPRI